MKKQRIHFFIVGTRPLVRSGDQPHSWQARIGFALLAILFLATLIRGVTR